MSTTNTANSDKFKLILSNVPQPATRTSSLNMEVFHSYVKGITFPDLSIESQISSFGNVIENTPVQKFNTNLGQLLIDFHVDEDFENYKAFYDWIFQIRSGCPTAGADSVKQSNISQIQVHIMDNENRTTNKMIFGDCRLTSLSSLTVNFGSSDELAFSTTFEFDSFVITKTTATLNN